MAGPFLNPERPEVLDIVDVHVMIQTTLKSGHCYSYVSPIRAVANEDDISALAAGDLNVLVNLMALHCRHGVYSVDGVGPYLSLESPVNPILKFAAVSDTNYAISLNQPPAPVAGKHVWQQEAVPAGGVSAAIDLNDSFAYIAVSGSSDTTTKITLQLSANNVTFINAAERSVTSGNAFCMYMTPGPLAKAARLHTSCAARLSGAIDLVNNY